METKKLLRTVRIVLLAAIPVYYRAVFVTMTTAGAIKIIYSTLGGRGFSSGLSSFGQVLAKRRKKSPGTQGISFKNVLHKHVSLFKTWIASFLTVA